MITQSKMNFYSTNSMKNFNENNCNNEDKYATINNTMDDEFNRFINAAKVGDLKEITHYVRKYPQYVNLGDSQCGFTALMHAAEGGHYNLIRPLVDNGADTNLKDSRAGRTALMLASSNGHTRCIETLITHGKAQIHLQDSQKHTAAYYATHHGHGNNKIIARLLQIQNSNNNNYQHFGNHNSNQANNNNSRYHQASSTNTSFNFSLDSPSSNNVTNSIIQDIQNQSFTEKGLSYFNSNTSSIDQYNQQHQRRYSIDTNSFHNQRLQDYLINNNSQSKQKQFMNRNHSKMRSNTISNTLSSRQQSEMSDILKSRNQGNHAFNIGNQGNQTFNGGNQNQLNSSNLNQFASLIYQNQQPDYRNVSKNLTFELQKLSIPDYNNNGNPISPINGNFPENGILNGNQKNYFQNDSMFETPQTNDLSLNQYCTDRVKNDLSNYSFNESNCNDSFRGNRPRNSTFSNGNGASDNSSQTSDETKDERFDGFAESLDCFLRQYCLERFRNTFSEKKIDLFTFLSLKENDLKNLGIVDEKDLADILSNQITYRNLIGMGKDLSNYCIYLMKRLESTKKELNKSKKEKFYLNLKKED